MAANTTSLVLRALGYGGSWSEGDSSGGLGSKKFRELVSWVEDTKIRLHKVEEREALRDHGSSTWTRTFEAYLEALECPYKAEDAGALDWVLNYALSLEYRDNANKLNMLTLDDPPAPGLGKGGAEKPFPDVGSRACRDLVEEMARTLDLPKEGVTTEALLERVRASVDPLVRAAEARNGVGAQIDLCSLPLGFTTGDEAVDSAALVLRSLYIQDLRGLQTTIDETVVGVQEYTANPKTDSKLGKVGR
ncbi:RNA transcription, translation and transport factor protein [Chloropicon primus]|uniref:Uncharacterized protein n=1 Tax=Chloropicon primus TaxID=1764295 RepID=A0A5B8MB99_9CHLO|nr:hypothetical protein A3770_01p02460 [Chloropicon primus]UPQ96946.1 RNA transcription, translation and transport factor protein [Chloropicon primus]|mmetsp:Transcript_9170/g.26075  ORF Transcript_9170/g.26075 Transcript_9170/m.26075 type:complete len:248 (-) Transcript_9170:553-1296(-)|eukprot:QDZ17728.1 hypothetical protein A3770_01p02460 [Chloropicon primus]